MNGDYITELRRMADMLERNEVWVKNFTLSMGFDGDMDIRICLNKINGSPVKPWPPVPKPWPPVIGTTPKPTPKPPEPPKRKPPPGTRDFDLD
jgi:hypothetical protein